VEFGRRILRMLPAAPKEDLPLDRLVVKSGGSTRFVRAADIDWIEAAGVYANLHVGGKELLYRAALNELAERLDPINVRTIRVSRGREPSFQPSRVRLNRPSPSCRQSALLDSPVPTKPPPHLRRPHQHSKPITGPRPLVPAASF